MNVMFMSDYQKMSKRTLNLEGVHSEQLTNMALGVAGEAGEVVDHIKKHVFHGHDLNDDKVKEELGDLLFYVAGVATMLGYDLDEIAFDNVKKLEKRFPKGFSQEASKARVDTKKDNLITDTRYKGMDKPLEADFSFEKQIENANEIASKHKGVIFDEVTDYLREQIGKEYRRSGKRDELR
jgi:NTP pyrophosphatase (non-canonical NTP hydrolase)